MNIAFRVDANQHIGMGHLSRCLSIAAQLAQNGPLPLFMTADADAIDLIRDKGFPVLCLNSAYNHLESEIDELLGIIVNRSIERLVIDSYFVTEWYLLALHKVVKTIYMDDLAAFPYPASFIINYNIYGSELDYSKSQARYDTRLLLGPDFAPLRAEFAHVAPLQVSQAPRHILISTGGADSLNLGEKIVRCLLNAFDNITVHLVAGRFASTFPTAADRLVIHRNITAMAELMLSCDLAVSAAGSTLYELCACGIPTISYAFADNQLFGARAFGEKNVIPYAGDFRESEENCLSAMIAEVNALTNSNALRQERSRRMQRLVDGKGAERIAQAVRNR